MWPFFNLQDKIVDPVSIPLLNTCLLLSSGVTVTAFHLDLVVNSDISSLNLGSTILLGAVFLVLQLNEYAESSFSFRRGVYGSSFFILTGFHGMHVIIGVILLSVSFLRSFNHTISKIQHVGIEARI